MRQHASREAGDAHHRARGVPFGAARPRVRLDQTPRRPARPRGTSDLFPVVEPRTGLRDRVPPPRVIARGFALALARAAFTGELPLFVEHIREEPRRHPLGKSVFPTLAERTRKRPAERKGPWITQARRGERRNRFLGPFRSGCSSRPLGEPPSDCGDPRNARPREPSYFGVWLGRIRSFAGSAWSLSTQSTSPARTLSG